MYTVTIKLPNGKFFSVKPFPNDVWNLESLMRAIDKCQIAEYKLRLSS